MLVVPALALLQAGTPGPDSQPAALPQVGAPGPDSQPAVVEVAEAAPVVAVEVAVAAAAAAAARATLGAVVVELTEGPTSALPQAAESVVG